MSGFQILNKDNAPVMFEVINKEVASLWNKPFNPHIGTRPYPSMDTLYSSLFEGDVWADKLLYLAQQYGSTDWEQLTVNLCIDIRNKTNGDHELYNSSIDYNMPYFKLIDELSIHYTFKFLDDTINKELT